jgi:hypothetical protein
MDALRSCYRSQMRLFSDRPDVLTWGRWRWSPPGAITGPPTVFFARRNQLQDEEDRPLGEVYAIQYAYTKGHADPRLTGLHYCGSQAWTQGILYADRPGLELDATGIPLCCSAAAPAPGGGRGGGLGVWGPVRPPVVTPSMPSVCTCATITGI